MQEQEIKGITTQLKGAFRGAVRFRDNLRRLIRDAGWTRKVAAEKMGMPFSRLRKLCDQGIAKITERNRRDVDKIRRTFGLVRSELLWSSKSCVARDAPKYSEDELNEKIHALVFIWKVNPRSRNLRRLYRSIDRTVRAIAKDKHEGDGQPWELEEKVAPRHAGEAVGDDFSADEAIDERIELSWDDDIPAPFLVAVEKAEKPEETLEGCHFQLG